MNTHEYQAKEVLQKYGVPIPEFGVASNKKEAKEVVERLGLKEAVVKIQVHAGGRGKAGGVKFAKSPEEIVNTAGHLIGMKMVNNQTGPDGVVAHKVIISKPMDIKKEYYIGAVIDRHSAQGILIASPEGGMDIEEVAAKHPEKILTLAIPSNGKMHSFQLYRLANFMGWKEETAKQGMKVAAALAKAFMDMDGSLLEINPLIENHLGEIWALDAKLSVDDNALYRQPEIASFYDPTQQSKNEVLAKEYDLSYVALDGNIGCMVNGAGLAMATMDIIHLYGGAPANFLDVGGGASAEKVAEGFKIILLDPKVKGIFVNIFGGIMNCATLAEGITKAAKELSLTVPLVVRMEGTNVEQGKKILKDSKLHVHTVDTMAEGAQKVVEVLK